MDKMERARELLAAELDGFGELREIVLSGSSGSAEDAFVGIVPALKAITAALSTPSTDSVMREALQQIDELCPVTCEMTTAHEMADIARAALQSSEADNG